MTTTRRSKKSRFFIAVCVLFVNGGFLESAFGAKPVQKFPEFRAVLADKVDDAILSDGLGAYIDGKRTSVAMNPNSGSIGVDTGSDRAFFFDFSRCVSPECETPFGGSPYGFSNESVIVVYYAGFDMLPGESKSVGIRVRIDSGDGRDWWLHFNWPADVTQPHERDPNPPTVSAYDLDGSDDDVTDTWVTQVTAETTPAVLYEFVREKGKTTPIERGRFIMPFSMSLIMEP